MSLIALPTTSQNKSRWMVWLLVPFAVLLALLTVWALGGKTGPVALSGGAPFHRVAPMDMDVKIVKDGELQAVNAIEIQSEVEGQTTIQTLVKEGTFVKKDDVLITLDSAAIRQKIEDTTLELQKAEADLTNAREMREIQISQNNANLEAAEVALILAQIALKQYEEGTYPQALANAKTELDMARINLKNAEEKLGQTRALQVKGFMTMTQVKDDELLVRNATNNVQKAETALDVLVNYTHQMQLAETQNALSQAEQKLARVKRENAASLSQKEADVRAKDQALSVMRRRMERLEEQLQACTIKAPADGMVVYATSNDRNAQSSLQEGAQVRERQNLLRLPDTSSMKAVVRIPETQVARLREGQRASILLPFQKEPIGASLTKISVLADSSQRWWNPDLKEYPVDLTLDQTPPSLKPGMGVNASIFIKRLHGVNAVPLTALYSQGPDTYVFERSGDGLKHRKVKIGSTNETHAEILEGVEHGADVKILQVGEGQELLERAGIKFVPPATTQPAADERPERAGPPEGMRPPGMGDAPTSPGAEPGQITPGGNGDAPRPRGDGQRRGGGGRRGGGQAPGGPGAQPQQSPSSSDQPNPGK
jgi:HlyD family secretion protein